MSRQQKKNSLWAATRRSWGLSLSVSLCYLFIFLLIFLSVYLFIYFNFIDLSSADMRWSRPHLALCMYDLGCLFVMNLRQCEALKLVGASGTCRWEVRKCPRFGAYAAGDLEGTEERNQSIAYVTHARRGTGTTSFATMRRSEKERSEADRHIWQRHRWREKSRAKRGK